MDAGAPPPPTASPCPEVGAPPSSRLELLHHRITVPFGGPPRHDGATSMWREREVEPRRKMVRWRAEECGKGAAGGCRMGEGGARVWGKEGGAPLYVVGPTGPRAIVPAHGPHRANQFRAGLGRLWAEVVAQHNPTSCSCRLKSEIIVLGPCSCQVKILCFRPAPFFLQPLFSPLNVAPHLTSPEPRFPFPSLRMGFFTDR
jgi:hypothetical protein